ncbi:hypothetical protein BCR39DRAFT_472710 [Naematelia encephala]|uniref:Phenylalanine--tRNA ligase, mitochondrial n=1 Tax=Naematelia encephala TaxID=71784 RepID=A0A1Y2APD0_9TREE|nr:hypothetical protein BCR39DRAFT_472710 [Naematelia encephala]
MPCHRHQSTTSFQPYTIDSQTYAVDSYSNTPSNIISKLPRHLHLTPNHPLSIIRQSIEGHFGPTFTPVTPKSAVVSVAQNFDELGFPADHPGRSITDSYYLNSQYMLRTHTSAHEVETYRIGLDRWLLTADVYRRDEIDGTHYPVFHQMEGTQVWPSSELSKLPQLNDELAAKLASCSLVIEDPTTISPSNPYQTSHDPVHAEQIAQHLKHSLNSLIFHLFGPIATAHGEPLRIRWIEAFFPFTTPSYEVEIWWNGEWLELLGCGVVMQKTLDQAGQSHKSGWAFGLGLERLAMVLFSIPDIRLFWSQDPRFLSQFSSGDVRTTFKPYSKYPVNLKDMSFWIAQGKGQSQSQSQSQQSQSQSQLQSQSEAQTQTQRQAIETPAETSKDIKEWHENDFCEIVRDVAGDLVETVTMIDQFTHPKTGRQSKTYRINYRSMDRSLPNNEVNALQEQISRRVVEDMGVEMR